MALQAPPQQACRDLGTSPDYEPISTVAAQSSQQGALAGRAARRFAGGKVGAGDQRQATDEAGHPERVGATEGAAPGRQEGSRSRAAAESPASQFESRKSA